MIKVLAQAYCYILLPSNFSGMKSPIKQTLVVKFGPMGQKFDKKDTIKDEIMVIFSEGIFHPKFTDMNFSN